MTQNYEWLKDQSRYQEVIDWLGGRWDVDQLGAWSNGRFGLDELKSWIDGKYTIDDVVTWRYHESDRDAETVTIVLDEFRPGVEKDKGTLAFLGIDEQARVHIAFDGACGSCTVRETSTMESLTTLIDEYFEGNGGVINDGPTRALTGNFGVEDFEQVHGSVVEIRPIGRNL